MRKTILSIPFVLFILCINPLCSRAQGSKNLATVDVSGYIMDDTGRPLSGILVKAGKSAETSISGENGEFSLKAGIVDNIGISQEGYIPVSIRVYNGRMDSDTIRLQRAGYFSEDSRMDFPFGTVAIDRSVGSVYTVPGEQLRKHPSGQVLEALTGLIPGLMIQQTSSRPGNETFRVTHLGKSVEVLIDGFPQDLNVSLREIEEVVMMKGAASTAMIGDMGADGILLIKTKKGRAGPRKLEFEYESGYGTPTAMGEYMGSYDYATMINQSLLNDGLQPIYGSDALSAYQTGSDPIRYPDVDYMDQFLRNNVTRQQFNGQFSGGNSNSRYFANFGYNGFDGLEKLDEKRSGQDFVFRTNLDLDINEHVNLDASLVGSFQSQRQPQLTTANLFETLSTYPPNAFPFTLGDSIYIHSRDWTRNMLFEMEEGGYVERTDRRMNMNLGLNVDMVRILPGLSFNAKVAIDIWNQVAQQLDHETDLYEILYEPRPPGPDTMIVNQTTSGSKQLNPSDAGESVQRIYNYFAVLNYDRIFNDHALNANLLAYQYIIEVDGRLNNASGLMFNFRTNYSYKGKYSAEAVLAYVGTNKLYESNRFKLFPTVGVSWLASREDFLKNSSFVDFLKVRGSFGQQGYMTINNYYSFWNRWDNGPSKTFGTYPTNNQNVPTFTKEQTGNPDLEWPVKNTVNIGADALVMNKALAIQLDYFYTLTKGELARYSIPDLAGGTEFSGYDNLESFAGSGLDIGLRYSKTRNDFYYALGINGGYYKETSKVLAEPAYPDENLLREGDPTDAIYGLSANGLFADNASAGSSNQKFGPVFAGDIQYSDINGDGMVDSRDRDVIGNSSPRIMYGLNLSLGYKCFGFYANFAGYSGFDVNMLNAAYYSQSRYNSRPAMLSNADLMNGNTMPRLSVLGSENNNQNSDYWLLNGSYLRLENVELSYRLPARLTTQWKIMGTKIFVRGRNLFSVSAFKNVDPEMDHAGFTDYPIFRELSVGLNLSF